MENKKIILGKKSYSYKTAKTIAITTKILSFLLVFMGIVLAFESLILGIIAIFFGVFMFVYSTILKKIICGNKNAMSREGKKWHKEKNKELKMMIKKATKEGMHPSFINLLKAQNKVKDKYKFKMEFHEGATEEELVKFEKTLGVTIPAPYREFLKFTNGADLGEAGVEFWGVSDDEEIFSLYEINDVEHDAYNIAGARNSNLLIFGMDLGNYLHGINMENGEVAYWDYTDPDGEEYSEISTDFYTYIEEHLIGFIKDKE